MLAIASVSSCTLTTNKSFVPDIDDAVAATCVEAMLEILSLSDDDPVAAAELVCIVND